MEGAAGPSESRGVADAEATAGLAEAADENSGAGGGAAEEDEAATAAEDADEAGMSALKDSRMAATDFADLLRAAALAAPPPRFLTGLERTLEDN